MNLQDSALKAVLLQKNYLAEEDIKKADTFLLEKKIPFFQYLIEENILTKDLIGQAIAESMGVTYTDLNSHKPSQEQVLRIPEEIAKQLRIVLFRDQAESDEIIIATDDPNKEGLLEECMMLFPGKDISLTYALSEDIEEIFAYYRKSLETRFSKIIKENIRIAPGFLDEIFEDALTLKSSDIHFEPQKEDVLVRFRVDGVLHEAGRIPKKYYENILNRIKIQSDLRIDEHFSAQDGSLRYEGSGKSVDMRTSIIPTIGGEKVVLRVLATYVQGLGLSDIGLSEKHQEILEEVAKKPFGMILVTGPTGCGKTTTLYSILKILNNNSVNITTIEDPVEYKVRGINQVQVNERTDLTFSKGLRSIVRQDPDIILVGEIRDGETAEIAVNAALTGHLLLSTFHANDAATAVPRLIDMDIEPFLLASTLEVVVAQRLVRRICDSCRYSIIQKRSEMNTPQMKACLSYFPEEENTLYAGKGCSMCENTGYKGRTAIFEFITITPAMRELIVRKPSSQEIWKLARSESAQSFFEDGIEKVKRGMTSLEELLRVAEPRNE